MQPGQIIDSRIAHTGPEQEREALFHQLRAAGYDLADVGYLEIVDDGSCRVCVHLRNDQGMKYVVGHELAVRFETLRPPPDTKVWDALVGAAA